MTGAELTKAVTAQVGKGYVWGGLGYDLKDGRITQLRALYPKVYTAAYIAKIKSLWFGIPVFDCVGLIKHFLWGNPGDGVLWKYDAPTDYDADTMLKKCTETGKIKDGIPEMQGLLVHRPGHVGVYAGGGVVIEARNTDVGVVKSVLKERDFVTWGRLPGLAYSVTPSDQSITINELIEQLREQGISTITI